MLKRIKKLERVGKITAVTGAAAIALAGSSVSAAGHGYILNHNGIPDILISRIDLYGGRFEFMVYDDRGKEVDTIGVYWRSDPLNESYDFFSVEGGDYDWGVTLFDKKVESTPLEKDLDLYGGSYYYYRLKSRYDNLQDIMQTHELIFYILFTDGSYWNGAITYERCSIELTPGKECLYTSWHGNDVVYNMTYSASASDPSVWENISTRNTEEHQEYVPSSQNNEDYNNSDNNSSSDIPSQVNTTSVQSSTDVKYVPVPVSNMATNETSTEVAKKDEKDTSGDNSATKTEVEVPELNQNNDFVKYHISWFIFGLIAGGAFSWFLFFMIKYLKHTKK